MPTTSQFTPDSIDDARALVARLHDLQECIIRRIAWSEPMMELVVELTYIWEDDGQTCFAAGKDPGEVWLRFTGVDEFHMANALTVEMLSAPDGLGWGASEIAALELGATTPSTATPPLSS